MITTILNGLVLGLFGVVFTAIFLFVLFAIANAVYFQRPLWRVYYPPEDTFGGGYSRRFDYWGAHNYAAIFNGEVVKHFDVDNRPADYAYVPKH